MDEKYNHNNPQKIFKEQDDLVVERTEPSIDREDLASIRHSEITSIVPDDINWNNIYAGKQHGIHSTKPEPGAEKK